MSHWDTGIDLRYEVSCAAGPIRLANFTLNRRIFGIRLLKEGFNSVAKNVNAGEDGDGNGKQHDGVFHGGRAGLIKKKLGKKIHETILSMGSGLPDNGNLALGQAYDSF